MAKEKKMKSILGFDYLLTPRVLVLFYWIAMLLIFAGGCIPCSATTSSRALSVRYAAWSDAA
jgi:hypothetical protein